MAVPEDDLSPLASLRLVVRENAPLAERTTLRIGGPARYLVEAQDAPSLAALLRFARERALPLRMLGKGSNVLAPDEGLPGFTVLLTGSFLDIAIEGTRVVAGGGASLMALAVKTRNAGLTGLECLSGIPSSIGGAIRINAGSYGGEIFPLLRRVTLVTRAGEVVERPAASIRHGYRWTELIDTDHVVAGGVLELAAAPADAIEARFREVTEKRRNALPKQPNAGSIFKNPPGRFAGKLLEECGMKGRRSGNAAVSEIHANVIVNLGGARAADVKALMDEMRRAVLERFGIELQAEVEVLG